MTTVLQASWWRQDAARGKVEGRKHWC